MKSENLTKTEKLLNQVLVPIQDKFMNYKTVTCPQIRSELALCKLSTSGLKYEIFNRLRNHYLKPQMLRMNDSDTVPTELKERIKIAENITMEQMVQIDGCVQNYKSATVKNIRRELSLLGISDTSCKKAELFLKLRSFQLGEIENQVESHYKNQQCKEFEEEETSNKISKIIFYEN